MNNNFCKNCGSPLNKEDKFCKNCGTIVNNQALPNNNLNMNYEQNNNGMINNYNQPSKSNKNLTIIIVAILLVIGIGVALFLILKPSDNGKNTDNTGNSSSSNVSSNTKKVSFEGYAFEIPTDYECEIDGEILSCGDKKDTWYFGIQIISGDFNNLISNKDQLLSNIEAKGYSVKTFDQEEHNGLKCITMKVDGFGHKMLMAYVGISSSKVAVISTVNLYKDYDNNLFEEAMKVLKTGL